MKTLFIAIILLFFTTSNYNAQEQNGISMINYETFTRGSSTIYKISPDKIEITSKSPDSAEKSKHLSFQEWAALLKHLEEVNVSRINQLKAPSDARASDAAPHAILSIRKNDTIYKTNSFDHGNAPTTMKPLIQAILRLVENVE